jgi:hypothetical protein
MNNVEISENKDYNDYTLDSNIDGVTSNRSVFDNRGRFFDPYKFNKEFEVYIEKQKKKRLLEQELKTYDLNKIDNMVIKPYNLPFKNIVLNTQSMWFRFFDNIINGEKLFKNSTFDDVFYVALTFITIFLLYIIIYSLFFL